MNTTKTCSHCQSEISALAKKCPQCKSDLRIWFARHPILTTFLIIFVGIPFMGGIIGSFTAKSDSTDMSNEVTEQKTATLKDDLTYAVAKISKLSEDNFYAEFTNISELNDSQYKESFQMIANRLQSMEQWRALITKGEQSTIEEEKVLAQQLKGVLVPYQKAIYPELRKKYGKLMDTSLWEADTDVAVSGTNSTTLTLTSFMYASNASIKSTNDMVDPVAQSLRFKRINYKWSDGADDYTYATLETPEDGDIQ